MVDNESRCDTCLEHSGIEVTMKNLQDDVKTLKADNKTFQRVMYISMGVLMTLQFFYKTGGVQIVFGR